MRSQLGIFIRARGGALALAGALCVVATAAGIASCGSEDSVAAKARPNLLVITTDDQTKAQFKKRYMPRTVRFFKRKGTTFTNGLAIPPLCCPARAGLLTGQYPHNHGIIGFPTYEDLKDKRSVLPAWLQRAGYRTAMVGKHLNRYHNVAGSEPGPGFGLWYAVDGHPGYYDYDLSVNGKQRHFGSRPRDYSTDVFSRRAARYVKAQSRRDAPFFMWLSYFAPHRKKKGTIRGCKGDFPHPKNDAVRRRFSSAPFPEPASYDERDVSDKPGYIRDLPRLSTADKRYAKRHWRCAVATLDTVDKGISRLIKQLRESGQLDKTIIFFASDNGYFYGEHRFVAGRKSEFLEPALNIPLTAYVPPAYRPGKRVAKIRQPVGIPDIAPTFLSYAGADSCVADDDCRRMDGRSVRGLLSGEAPGGTGPDSFPKGRGVLVELSRGCADYRALRTKNSSYGEPGPDASPRCGRGLELYDLKRDPDQLRNLAGRPAHAALRDQLAARLAELELCSGIEGRDEATDAPFCE